jgi:hypothetical protein
MATGGLFTILTNGGKQDTLLMASEFLREKLLRSKQKRIELYGKDSEESIPSISEIEETHILFTNAHFKPFASIGFEYRKQQPTAGSTNLGDTVTFAIPQFGDFFHDNHRGRGI